MTETMKHFCEAGFDLPATKDIVAYEGDALNIATLARICHCDDADVVGVLLAIASDEASVRGMRFSDIIKFYLEGV